MNSRRAFWKFFRALKNLNLEVLRRLARLPLVVVRSLWRDESHFVGFFVESQILAPLRYFEFSDPFVEEVAAQADRIAGEVVGADHDTYSGATAPEVASAFALCIRHGMRDGRLDYLEIGSAKGKSMGFIGAFAIRSGCEFRGTSIDPYFEAAYREGADRPDLFLRGAGPYVAPIDATDYEKATRYWRELGLVVEQLRLTSGEGIELLRTRGVQFDLIYIDGLHDGLAPMQDLVGCLKLARKGGVIMLDDRHWASVHHVRKICSRCEELRLIHENWKISAYEVRECGERP